MHARRLALGLLIVLASIAFDDVHGQEDFTYVAPKPGYTSVENTTIESKGKVAVAGNRGKAMSSTIKEKSELRIKRAVLKLDEGKPSRDSIDFQVVAGTEFDELEGRRFECQTSSGKVSVLDGNHNYIENEAGKEVQKQLERANNPHALSRYLAGRVIKRGKTLSIPAKYAKSFFFDYTGPFLFDEFTLKPKRVKEIGGFQCIEFKVVMKQKMHLKGAAGSKDSFSGTYVVRQGDGWPVSLKLKGTSTMYVGDNDLAMGGKSKFTIEMSWTHTQTVLEEEDEDDDDEWEEDEDY